MSTEIRIGTRGSPLALAQAALLKARLIAFGQVEADGVEIVIIRTSGDRIQDRSLADIGGKGLFTKEIEEALTDGRVDLAVHSLKDVPAWMPDGLVLGAVLPRVDPRDALISLGAKSIAELPQGARVGTSSPRRKALLLHRRPDLEIVEFRGNVGTRLAKLEAGEVDATLLGVAGLIRLSLDAPHYPIDTAYMLPAACQGAIGIEIRAADDRAQAICAAIGDVESAIAATAERAFLAALDGSCRTPIAALARVDGDTVRFEGLIARMDGGSVIGRSGEAPLDDAFRLGDHIGQSIKSDMPLDFFAAADLG
jgi:hydroxymethylbilane synthase